MIRPAPVNPWRDTRTWVVVAAGTVALGALGAAVGRNYRVAKAVVAGLLGGLLCIHFRERVVGVLDRLGDLLLDLGTKTARRTASGPASPASSGAVDDATPVDPALRAAVAFFEEAKGRRMPPEEILRASESFHSSEEQKPVRECVARICLQALVDGRRARDADDAFSKGLLTPAGYELINLYDAAVLLEGRPEAHSENPADHAALLRELEAMPLRAGLLNELRRTLAIEAEVVT